MADQDETQLYEDLKEFLQSPRSDLRSAATEGVLQLAHRDRHALQKLTQVDGIVSLLAKNVHYPDTKVSLNALQALLHMTSNGPGAKKCVEDLMQAGGMNRMMELLLSSSTTTATNQDGKNDEAESEQSAWRQRVNYAMALVVNMTRTEAGSVELVGRTLPEEAVAAVDFEGKLPPKPTLELLLARFLNPNYILPADYETLKQEGEDPEAALASQSSDPFQHFGAVLMNATQIEAGRLFVLKIHRDKDDKDGLGRTVLQAILSHLKSPNPLRRRGIAGTIRNCCLDPDFTWWLLNVIKISSHVLYPLAGPEELDIEEKQGLDPDLWLEGPDKKRETDYLTRLFLVESIMFLCTSGRKARETLRNERVAVVLKWADMVEEQEDVSEQIGECMKLLKEENEEVAADGNDIVEPFYGKPTAARQVGTNNSDNFDDVD